MGLLQRRMGRLLTLALAAVWVVAVASGDALLTPGMRCHDMPCCPRSDGGMQSCSTAQCVEQAPEKAEAARQEQAANTVLAAGAAPADDAARPGAGTLRERTPGRRFAASVFRLKDDLRI